MKKANRFRQTVGAFMAAMSLITAPQQSKAVEMNNAANKVRTANKNSTLPRQERKQGISISNRIGGGLDFDMPRMMEAPNPIYIPYYHPKQTYRAQVRKSKSRKNRR